MDKFTQMAIEYPELLNEYEAAIKKLPIKKAAAQKNTTAEILENGAQKATEEDIYY